MAAHKSKKFLFSLIFTTCCTFLLEMGVKAHAQGDAAQAYFAGTFVSQESLVNNIAVLSGVEAVNDQGIKLPNRFTQPNKNLVRKWINQKGVEWGYKPTIETADVETRRGPQVINNMIFEKRGHRSPNEVIEVLVHYDSRSNVVVGADDNASGVSVGLELARILSKFKTGKTVRIIFSDLEEGGLHGARAHVKLLKNRPQEKIVGAVVVDTIGHHPDKRNQVIDLVMGPKTQNIELANNFMYQEKAFRNRKSRFFPITYGTNPHVSDMGPYYDVGLPTVFFRENLKFWNQGYHTPQDTIETINPEYLKNAAKIIIEGTARLAEASVGESIVNEYAAVEAEINYLFEKQIQPETNFVKKARPVFNLFVRLLTFPPSSTFHRIKRMGRMISTKVFKKSKGVAPEEEILRREISELESKIVEFHRKDKHTPADVEVLQKDLRLFEMKWDISTASLCQYL